MTPLEMARNAAANVERYAQYQADDPLGSFIAHAGQQGQHAAEVAACMALVSIAEDVHRIADAVDRMAAPDVEDAFEDGPGLRRPSEPPP